jgi:DNA-binding transcriptional LysR family regulator
VEAGLGVALIQGIAIEREITAGNLVALALRGGDDTRTYLVAQRKRRELSMAAKSLIELLGALT